MRKNDWATRVMAVLRTGNTSAAIAQIKVAPTPKDLAALRTDLAAAGWTGRWPAVDVALEDNLALLLAPRLHRAP